jgi:murein DD-endopeptidase MepM/ murein hydrolase activator NlpD
VPPRLSRQTRIILIPDGEGRTREFVIGRGMVVGLCLLLVLLSALVVWIMISHAAGLNQSRRAEHLQAELDEFRRNQPLVQDLSAELEQMRALQERLLVMLGVQRDTSATEPDSLVAASMVEFPDSLSGLEEVALVMTPPPDLWPSAGFVTREFQAGDPPRGVLPHLGIDLAGPLNSAIKAAGKGRVSHAGWDDYLGNFVEIQHGFGYLTVYGHCSRTIVRKGDRVDRGQVIGYLGGTGETSAPHLHFEVWKEGEAVDPREVIPGEPPR